MTTYKYTNDPTEIAADLRRIADQLDQLEGVNLTRMMVSLDVLLVEQDGTPAERRESVDTLTAQLLPDVSAGVNGSARLYRTGLHTTIGHVGITIYTVATEVTS